MFVADGVRRCSRCRDTKPVVEFAPKGSRGGRDSYRRSCRREYGREHYVANKKRYIAQTRIRNDRRFRERVLFLLDYFKSHPCRDCGETDPVVLEFDHLRDKEFEIASGIHYRAWSAVLAEIAKCDVVCANCHRRRTSRRRGALRAVLSDAGN